MSKLSSLVFVLVLALGCGAKHHALDIGDGGTASDAGIGSGGSTAGGFGTGGDSGSGGTGTGGGSGGPGTGGTPGTGGAAGNPFDGILDGGLGGLLDSGIVGTCPANPAGQPCGGPGMPIGCVQSGSDGGLAGCFCVQRQWFCGTPGGASGDGGLPGLPIGPGMGMTMCPANAAGMACTGFASFCANPSDGGARQGCICLPGQGGGSTWRCL